jgi:signal transduction histidine kinase
LAYFFATSLLSSLPSVVIASRFVAGISESWFTADFEKALDDANWFALDSYRQRLKTLELAAKTDLAEKVAKAVAAGNRKDAAVAVADSDAPIVAVQGYSRSARGDWEETFFFGDRAYSLPQPPAVRPGFLPRSTEPTRGFPGGRDADVIRYIAAKDDETVRILTLSLGERFDRRTARISQAAERAGAVGMLRPTLSRTLILLYGVFLLPSLLMTLIIAFSLTTAVTQPLMSLADATRRVAEGDFSIRLIERPGDELGTLVASFNAMVRELARSRTALLRTEKINLWQDMAQRLAHEIKNPLTPIKLSAERVLRRAKSDPEHLTEIVDSCMLAIIQEVDGLSTMLTDFRSFARMPPPTLERAKAIAVIEDAAALYRSSYPGIEFDISGVDAEIVVEADRRHFSQVIANLILNAVDAMEGKGRIEFRAELVKKRDSRYCRISIRDNGKGIPEEARPHIFTPYFTTKETGTGLGLPIVERIVNDHGGTIWFDTAVGVGTTFYIDLPIRN